MKTVSIRNLVRSLSFSAACSRQLAILVDISLALEGYILSGRYFVSCSRKLRINCFSCAIRLSQYQYNLNFFLICRNFLFIINSLFSELALNMYYLRKLKKDFFFFLFSYLKGYFHTFVWFVVKVNSLGLHIKSF